MAAQLHNPLVDASQVLAAALEQMDDIIAGSKQEPSGKVVNGMTVRRSDCDTVDVYSLLEKLKTHLQKDDNDNARKIDIPYDTADFIYRWLKECLSESNVQGFSYEELQQKILQLESEKENLMLQASVLNEQVEAQNEKIKELESTLYHNKEQLSSSEAMLKQEMDSRSSLENNKLELMTKISSLRMKLAAVEQEREELEEKNSKLESELILTCACLAEKEADLATLQSKLPQNEKSNSILDKSTEIQKLKNALSSVIAANDEKERKIQELNASLTRCKKFQELVLSNHLRRGSDSSCSSGYTKGPFDESGNLDPIIETNGKMDVSVDGKVKDKPPLVPRSSQQPLATSSPLHEHHQTASLREADSLRCSPILSSTSQSLPTNYSNSLPQHVRSSSTPYSEKTPPARRHYGTIPRQYGADVLLQIQHQLQQHKLDPSSNTSSLERSFGKRVSQSSQSLHHPGLDIFRQSRTKASGVSFGKGFFRLRSGKRSSSAPELVAPEHEGIGQLPETVHSSTPTCRRSSSPSTNVNTKEKHKGIKKIFGKLKRTGSENLGANAAEFKRGGIRATAGPRLGWQQDGKKFNTMNMPFAQWNNTMLADWLQTLGLGMYSNECKKYVKNGEQLLKANSSDFEKELGIKNPLHRKKLLLAIVGAKGDDAEPYHKIDYHWSVRWLDDIGLPQYKDAFFDARVDGSVLHHLTVEDLFHLKVTNQLHHISIKRGIQVLRENNFDPQCLKRRCLPDDEDSPSEVSKWTNHRVMEWLRTVDLSEYAPNLRGSGVHGGLMVYEPCFNADLLASLLNIPPNKTLLRRHLCTQFKQLVGSDLMQKKREWETQPSYTPLSPGAKVKVVRRGQISLIRKRNKAETEFEDFVCPMDLSNQSSGSIPSNSKTQDSSTEEKEKQEKFLMKESNILCSSSSDEVYHDMNALTELLQNEKVFESMTTTNV